MNQTLEKDTYQAYDVNGVLIAECTSYQDMLSIVREQFHSITIELHRNGEPNQYGYLRVTPKRTKLVSNIDDGVIIQ